VSWLLHCGGFEGYIARILAARAARSMRGGGGARESKVLCVLGGVVVQWERGVSWEGVISHMLAFNATKSMRGGGGANESQRVVLVAGSKGEVGDGRGVVVVVVAVIVE